MHTLLYLADVFWMPLRRKVRRALTGHFIVMLNYLDTEKIILLHTKIRVFLMFKCGETASVN